MRIFHRLFGFVHAQIDMIDHSEVVALPRIERLFHRKTRRHFTAMATGASMCVLGSAIAHNPQVLELLPNFLLAHVPGLHLIWDAFGYSIHGIGLIPFGMQFEPLWRIFAAE